MAERDPRAEYVARLAARQAEVARLGARDRALSTARLILFGLSGAALWAGLGPRWFPAALALVPAAAFVGAVAWHARALEARRRAERSATFYERGLQRIDDTWAGKGFAGDRYDDPNHPFARDLDLFGRGSLFELLCTTRTQAGEDTLAAWLKRPAPAAEARARQAAVAELRDRVDLREALAILGADVRAEVDPDALAKWSTSARRLTQTWLRPIFFLLALAGTAALVGWLGFDRGWTPLVIALVVVALVGRAVKQAVAEVTGGVDRPGRHLTVLAGVLARLEAERFESPRLRALALELTADRQVASRQIARLGTLVDAMLAQRNQFFAPLAWMWMWEQQFAFAIEAWRARAGAAIPRWLAAVGELEALCALSAYAYEHPGDPFPELSDEGPRFDGAGLGHPLLPAASCVRNDLALGGERRLYLVSGSNMSGKSTLLRTVGVNAVLAFAGAPVRATRLTLSSLALGATLRIQDSLAEGASRFYAEISRLQQIVQLAGQGPTLFLLDEILAGTNSHDRRLGAEAVVKGLLARGAIGLCTTHDLALAEMAAALGKPADNVHFEDHLEAGRLVFDYRMRPGVVQKSNALALMRAVGLEV